MDETNPPDAVFEALAAESRVARTARMLSETNTLQENQRTDILERFAKFMEEHGCTQNAVARELGISSSTFSDILRRKWNGKNGDSYLAKIHNWMELAARRENIVRKKKFVETSVARDILHVAEMVAETCKMGVVFGPGQIGKTMTLEAIQGDQRFGAPLLIRIDESVLRPLALCRRIAGRFELVTAGTFDAVFHRIVERLTGTKRMIMFDEIERAHYRSIEMIRDLHDETGCPVLLCGKPAIYEKLGVRHVGEFSLVTDQLAARIVIARDLTLRTREKNPQPLFTVEDIRKIIHQFDLKLHVAPDAVKWLQMRASSLGTGGLGKSIVYLFWAYKLAFVKGDESITAEHLNTIADMTMGDEDAQRLSEVVAESSGMRRVI